MRWSSCVMSPAPFWRKAAVPAAPASSRRAAVPQTPEKSGAAHVCAHTARPIDAATAGCTSAAPRARCPHAEPPFCRELSTRSPTRPAERGALAPGHGAKRLDVDRAADAAAGRELRPADHGRGHRRDVPVVRAAAAADDVERRPDRFEPRVIVAELARVTRIELGRGVELR